MIRLLFAALVACLLLGWSVQAAHALHQPRLVSVPAPAAATWDLDRERSRWQSATPESLAGRGLRDEALAALDQLQRLDAQRARLLALYAALGEGLETQEAYRAERLAYERRLAEQEADLDALRRRVDTLRVTPSNTHPSP